MMQPLLLGITPTMRLKVIAKGKFSLNLDLNLPRIVVYAAAAATGM